MGQEARCTARYGGRTSEGKALLEGEELLFRGDFALRIPFKSVTGMEARQGRLSLRWSGGTASFELGPRAETWALKIRYPRSLLDKLGVKPGSRVSLLGIDDKSFRAQLRERTDAVTEGRAAKNSDLVFVGMTGRAELPKLAKLRGAIKKNGAIWVVWPKGRKEFREDDVRNYGPQAGLVDVKVVSFSETLSALKMMIPVAQR